MTPDRIRPGGTTSFRTDPQNGSVSGSGTDKDYGSGPDLVQTLSVSANKAVHPARIRSGHVNEVAHPAQVRTR